MKDYPLTEKCKDGECGHEKCECGHCARYHVFRTADCGKVNIDLSTCRCKAFDAAKYTERIKDG